MRYILIFSMLWLAACGSKSDSLQPTADKAIENITCPNAQSRLFDVAYASLVDLKTIPTKEDLSNAFEKSLKDHPDLVVDHEQFLNLVNRFYDIILKVDAQNPKEMLEKVAAMEVGDTTTSPARKAHQDLQTFQDQWNEFAAQQTGTCSDLPPSVPPVTPTPEINLPTGSVVLGAEKVLATAYQSCSAIELPPMTRTTPDVVGIEKVGTHPDGVGSLRAITDLASVQRTDYYLQNWTRPASSCLDVRNGPLIYDYGGKPSTTSDPNSPIDLFSNAGSGTSVLGIDCSGFVFSAIASGGLRLDPAKKLKAVLVNGISSRMYMDPANNGMPCLEKVKMGVSGTLHAGDVTAIPGHVFIIDSVGKDPFGISTVTSASQCDSLTSDKFDFVIAQSSPSKNGIGINKYFGPDYLDETDSIRQGFEKYARDACHAKFSKTDVLMSATNFQIVRHKQSGACVDQPIALVGESCIKSCASLVSTSMPNSSQARIE